MKHNKNLKDFLNEQITYKLDSDYINYYINSNKITLM
jgi:hypothetical protein